MADCCESKAGEIALLRERQRSVLVAVLWINAAMFAVEFTAGIVANSSALLADSLDMLGDALIYGFSLYVLTRSALWKARVALGKGMIQAAFGVAVLVEVADKVLHGGTPLSGWMATIGALALVANLACLWLLTRYREQDLNMRSVWLCSRNDVIANVGVLVAAALVYASGSAWPDIVVGVLIAGLFLNTAVQVTIASVVELKIAGRST